MKWKVLPILFTIAIAIFLVGCAEESGEADKPDTKSESAAPQQQEKEVDPGPDIESTFEYKLATINAGYKVDEDDPTITEFSAILDDMALKTENTREELSDSTVKAQQILRKKSVEIGLLTLARELNTSMPDGATDLDIAEIAAAYITLNVQLSK
ncbi:MAG: hypothetical protein KAX16_08215 [Actinomycetia bacterium]|nr:hypothetical protein [Actinomycetes bacterium]